MSQAPRVYQAAPMDRREPGSARRATDRTLAQRIEAARQEGLAEGMGIGAAKVHGEIEPLLNALGEALRNLDGARASMMEAAVPEVARLAVKIAEKILGEKVASDPAALAALVRAALAPLGSCGPIEVRLNDGDVARCEAAGLALVALEGVSIVPDASVPAGGCRVRTSWGEIGAGVTDQIRRVEEIFDLEAADG